MCHIIILSTQLSPLWINAGSPLITLILKKTSGHVFFYNENYNTNYGGTAVLGLKTVMELRFVFNERSQRTVQVSFPAKQLVDRFKVHQQIAHARKLTELWTPRARKREKMVRKQTSHVWEFFEEPKVVRWGEKTLEEYPASYVNNSSLMVVEQPTCWVICTQSTQKSTSDVPIARALKSKLHWQLWFRSVPQLPPNVLLSSQRRLLSLKLRICALWAL